MSSFTYLIIALLLIHTTLAEECFTKKRCGLTAKRQPRSENDYWTRFNKKTNSCVMCVCGEVKKYTKSCIVDDVPEEPYKAKGLLKKVALVSKSGKSKVARKIEEEKDGILIRNEEIHLTKAEALKVECSSEPQPIFDEDKGTFTFSPMKYIHYMYTEKVMHCCSREHPKIKLPTKCEVKYNDRCDARFVEKENHSILCKMPTKSKRKDTENKH